MHESVVTVLLFENDRSPLCSDFTETHTVAHAVTDTVAYAATDTSSDTNHY